ncbi:MAG TPA: ABC transporter permease [Stellaceae bacterium]|jgi:NitT/TauT family transport system permease protein|nr:ABC transporter permease [Stellaceae bacterium]
MNLAQRFTPLLVGFAFLAAWQVAVDAAHVPPYILPSPSRVALTLWVDRVLLAASLWFTLKVTCAALVAAVIGGGGLALLFARSPLLERSLYPYAVILQVTPIVAIAPLIIIWVDNIWAALLICAWIVAFFPVLSNTSLGLHSTDPNLEALFKLYGARPSQRLRYLALPTALPYFLGGLRISGGLALIGAVVAEFVAGAGGRESGLAYRILESGYRLDIPRMFAALFLISVTGIAIFGLLSALSRLLLKNWHESSIEREL